MRRAGIINDSLSYTRQRTVDFAGFFSVASLLWPSPHSLVLGSAWPRNDRPASRPSFSLRSDCCCCCCCSSRLLAPRRPPKPAAAPHGSAQAEAEAQAQAQTAEHGPASGCTRSNEQAELTANPTPELRHSASRPQPTLRPCRARPLSAGPVRCVLARGLCSPSLRADALYPLCVCSPRCPRDVFPRCEFVLCTGRRCRQRGVPRRHVRSRSRGLPALRLPQAHPHPGRRHGYHDSEAPAQRGGLPRRAIQGPPQGTQGRQRSAVLHAAADHPGDPLGMQHTHAHTRHSDSSVRTVLSSCRIVSDVVRPLLLLRRCAPSL